VIHESVYPLLSQGDKSFDPMVYRNDKL